MADIKNMNAADAALIEALAAHTQRTRLEADFAKLVTMTRRGLAEALLVAREHASHPFIARLEAQNAAMRAALNEIADTHIHEWDAVDPQEVWACETCDVDSQDYASSAQETARAALARFDNGY